MPRRLTPAEARAWEKRRREQARQARAEPEVPALRVVQTSESPEWWKVLDADGEQHGAAKRTQEEAEALLEDLTGA